MSGANPSASGGQEPPASSVGQEPTKADQKSAKTTSGPESGEGKGKKFKKIQNEAKSLRDRLRAAERERDEAKKSQQSDAERKEQRLAELEALAAGWKQKEQELIVKNAVTKAALKRNLDPDIAEKLINWSAIKFDENSGEPKGVGKALDALVEQFPILKSQQNQQQPSIGATNPQQSSQPTTKGGDPLNPPRLGDVLEWK